MSPLLFFGMFQPRIPGIFRSRREVFSRALPHFSEGCARRWRNGGFLFRVGAYGEAGLRGGCFGERFLRAGLPGRRIAWNSSSPAGFFPGRGFLQAGFLSRQGTRADGAWRGWRSAGSRPPAPVQGASGCERLRAWRSISFQSLAAARRRRWTLGSLLARASTVASPTLSESYPQRIRSMPSASVQGGWAVDRHQRNGPLTDNRNHAHHAHGFPSTGPEEPPIT